MSPKATNPANLKKTAAKWDSVMKKMEAFKTLKTCKHTLETNIEITWLAITRMQLMVSQIVAVEMINSILSAWKQPAKFTEGAKILWLIWNPMFLGEHLVLATMFLFSTLKICTLKKFQRVLCQKQ